MTRVTERAPEAGPGPVDRIVVEFPGARRRDRRT
jgi:hypothetical protein